MGLFKKYLLNEKENKLKFLYIFNNGDFRKVVDFKLLPDRYISIKGDEPTPIEDIGDYFLTDKDITPEEAFEEWPGK